MGRIRYIDGLRALAVLLVVAHHVMRHSPALVLPVHFFSLEHALLEGSHGVDLFFVLSGFCLSYPVLSRLRLEHASRLDVTRYFAKRLVRIVPPYYAAIALLLLIPSTRDVAGAGDVFKQLLFLDWHTTFLNGSFWTLCVEFRWYFFFPVALVLWIRSPRAFWLVACASVVLYNFTRVHAPDVGTLLPFMLGIVAADLEIQEVPVERIAYPLLLCSLLVAALIEPWASMPAPSGTETPIFFVQTNPGWQVAAFAFVLLAGRIRALRSALSLAPLVAIGIASYSIYLVHEPIVTAVQTQLNLPFGQSIAASYVAAVGAGFAFWLLFERAWMSGPLKARAVALLELLTARVARLLQVPATVAFWEPAPIPQIAALAPEGESAPA